MDLFEKDKKSRVMHRLLQYSVHVGVEVAVHYCGSMGEKCGQL